MLTTRSNYKTLDRHGTLLGRASQKAHREPLKRLARGVLIAIGIALCSASPAGVANTSQPKITEFRYASFLLKSEYQASCLFKIALKESNVRYNAINRSSGALGAWQILNPKVATLSSHEQVEWAIRYAEHRYQTPCEAWEFWKVNKWW